MLVPKFPYFSILLFELKKKMFMGSNKKNLFMSMSMSMIYVFV